MLSPLLALLAASSALLADEEPSEEEEPELDGESSADEESELDEELPLVDVGLEDRADDVPEAAAVLPSSGSSTTGVAPGSPVPSMT